MATFITPVDITPTSFDAWVDADLSAYLPAGATGAILRIVDYITGPDAFAIGARKNGSTDNRIGVAPFSTVNNFSIGVDGSRIVELYLATGTVPGVVWLDGYYTTDAVFATNGTDKSTANTGVWEDVDISGDTGADTAIGAILEYVGSATTSVTIGLRKNGSTDNRVTHGEVHAVFIIGVDGSEIFEQQIGTTAADIFLVGYIKSNAVFNTNATDRSLGSTGAWTDLTALPSGAIGGIYETIGSEATTEEMGLRANGSAEAIIFRFRHAWPVVKCDASQLVEHYIESTAVDLFEVGYFITIAYALSATAGSFAWTGVSTGLQKALTLSATAGSFAWSSVAPGLLATRRLAADVSSFAWTGVATGLQKALTLGATAGAFAWSGVATGLQKALTLTAAVGSFLWSGSSVSLTYSGVPAVLGSFFHFLRRRRRKR